MREIEVLLDQPAVGENLSDHAAAYAVWTTPEEVSLLRALEPAGAAGVRSHADRSAGVELRRVRRLRRASAPTRPRRTSSSTSYRLQIIDEGMSDPDAHGFLATPCLLTPHSRGNVRLGSNDPTPSRSSTTPTTPPATTCSA